MEQVVMVVMARVEEQDVSWDLVTINRNEITSRRCQLCGEHEKLEASLEDASLEDAKLENKRLEDSRLEDTRLENARLENKRLEDSRLENKRLENKKLEDTKLENVKLDNATLGNKTLKDTKPENIVTRSDSEPLNGFVNVERRLATPDENKDAEEGLIKYGSVRTDKDSSKFEVEIVRRCDDSEEDEVNAVSEWNESREGESNEGSEVRKKFNGEENREVTNKVSEWRRTEGRREGSNHNVDAVNEYESVEKNVKEGARISVNECTIAVKARNGNHAMKPIGKCTCNYDENPRKYTGESEHTINGMIKHKPGKYNNKHDKTKDQKTPTHIHTEGLFFTSFLSEVRRSGTYRQKVIEHWTSVNRRRKSDSDARVNLHVRLHDTLPYVMDYAWGKRLSRDALERQHLDTVMSWLSTLGGACSALGDYFSGFAERAWAISARQFEIALRLGDPNIISRCKLYAAISLIQQCRFKSASKMIKKEYYWAHTVPAEVRDGRLVKMCHGIWAKLRYEREEHRLKCLNSTA